MTLLATIHLDKFAIIASDKKEVFITDGIIVARHEHGEKIIDTGIGLITGTGYVEFLSAVKKKIAASEITNTNQIMEIISNARDLIKNSSFKSAKKKEELLEKERWLFTDKTMLENAPCLRVGFYQPSIDENHLAIIKENTSRALFPKEVSQEVANKFSSFLSDNIQTLENTPDFNNNLNHNVTIILNLMNEVSKITEKVSKTCDIGVVFKDKSTTLLAKDISVESPNFTFIEL
jgi:hypothetical protein